MKAKACVNCVKRHELRFGLECRAKPPVPDVGGHRLYPRVRFDDYCHDSFEPDQERVGQLSDMVAPLVGADGEPMNPPQSDLALDMADPPAIGAIGKRARRAQPQAGELPL